MAAGLFGYLGYDTVRLMERLPDVNPDPLGLPDGILMRPTIMAIFDAVRDEVTVVTPGVSRCRRSPRKAAFARANERLWAVLDAFDRPLDQRAPERGASDRRRDPRSNTTPAEYLAMVDRRRTTSPPATSSRWCCRSASRPTFTLPPFALYRALRRINPSPFLYYLDFDRFALIGSSPEILVRVRDGKVTIRPIAGTRRRGATPAEDRALADDLLADPKERAEHLMLLDLGRNDVGRVADDRHGQGHRPVHPRVLQPGDAHRLQRRGQALDTKYDAIDALVAGFPAGTVSGAPKVRAMEIIDELEKDKRGPYAGCVGYFSADGDMDTCIVLRTAIVKDGKMYVQAGAGIVADSVPESEHQECVNKAKALFRAAEEAVRFAGPAPGEVAMIILHR